MSQDHEIEVQIAFAVFELCTQLKALLWDRYFDQFNDIMREKETLRGMEEFFPF
jgi:hypothetical protein